MVRSAEHGLQTSLKFFGHHVERSPEKDQRPGELFMEDIKKKYKTVMADHFPETMKIVFGDQTLEYRKRTWEIADSSGGLIEKGLRYGENPGQEAALYELTAGNLVLGDCRFVAPGEGLVGSLTESEMVQAGKHPGKINLTDVDNALNILKFLMQTPACAIMKHNNPSGVAIHPNLSEAYCKANMADRIAAFGGAAVFNRPVDKPTAKLIAENYLEVVAAPDYEEGSVAILSKRRNLRILAIPKDRPTPGLCNPPFCRFQISHRWRNNNSAVCR